MVSSEELRSCNSCIILCRSLVMKRPPSGRSCIMPALRSSSCYRYCAQRFVQVGFRENWHPERRCKRNVTEGVVGQGLRSRGRISHGSHFGHFSPGFGLVDPATTVENLSKTDTVWSDDGQPSVQVQFKNLG